MAASLPLQTLKRRARSRIKPARKLNIQATIKQLESIRISSRLSADDLSQLRTIVKKALKRLRYSDRLNALHCNRITLLRWQAEQGARLASTRDTDQVLRWLLGRKSASGVAIGKRTFAKLGREHYVKIGKLGAESRWKAKHKQDFATLGPLCWDTLAVHPLLPK